MRFRLTMSLTLLSTAYAQDDGVVRLKVETRVVQVSVAVKDARGRPVRDLRKEDFTVTDEGKPRVIALFSGEQEHAGPAPRPASLPPNVFSNRFGTGASSGRVTAILIDGVNTGWGAQSYARERAIEAVDRMAPGESIALYAMKPDLVILQDYTTDRKLLRKALQSFWPERPQQTDRVPTKTPSIITQMPRNALSAAMMRRRIEDTLSYMRLISSHMAGASGRKSIVWLTGGFPPVLDYAQEIDLTLNAINDANVAIYPVDVRGLLASAGAAINISLMRRFAEQTGGQAYYNRNDIGEAIVEAVEDARYTYSLGFYLSDTELDGRFHQLKVKVSRPGLVLHARRGYSAVRDPMEEARKHPKGEPAAVLLSPIDSAGIGIDATIENTADGMLRIRVTILPGEPGTYIYTAVLMETDERGFPLERVEAGLNIKYSGGQAGMRWEKTIARRSGATHLRLFLRDPATGRTGSLTIPL